MTSKFKSALSVVTLIIVMLFQIAACDSNSDVDRFVQAEEVAALGLSVMSLTSDVSLINADETVQFSVSGKDSAGTAISDLDTKVTWSTSNSDLAVVDKSGLVTAKADGVVTVTARYAYLSASSVLTINTADLVQISLSGDVLVDECRTLGLTASGVFSDGSTRVISSGLSWSVAETTLARIEAGTGNSATLLTHEAGIVSVQASKDGVNATLDVEIADTLQEFVISPIQADVSIGSTVKYSANGVYADSNTFNITESTVWRSVSSDIAAFDTTANGVLKGIAEGSTSLVGACGALSATATVVVNSVTLSKVEINYNKSSITLDKDDDDGYQLTLRASYSDGTVVDVTDDADWSNVSSASGSIVVSDDGSDKGELTLTGTGSANIEADFEGKSDTILIIVE